MASPIDLRFVKLLEAIDSRRWRLSLLKPSKNNDFSVSPTLIAEITEDQEILKAEIKELRKQVESISGLTYEEWNAKKGIHFGGGTTWSDIADLLLVRAVEL